MFLNKCTHYLSHLYLIIIIDNYRYGILLAIYFVLYLISMGKSSYKYSKKGYFHDIGLGMKDGTVLGGRWKMKRFKSIMEELGHEDVNI